MVICRLRVHISLNKTVNKTKPKVQRASVIALIPKLLSILGNMATMSHETKRLTLGKGPNLLRSSISYKIEDLNKLGPFPKESLFVSWDVVALHAMKIP